jgi:5'-nucleotidase
MLSSGDNFLAGAEFAASLEKGVPFYDSIAMSHVGYDAIAIGNHEFDFGPDVLADFIEGFSPTVPFLSANLDVSGEPALAALQSAGAIAKSTIVNERDELIGVIGATTPQLPNISSPRNVTAGLVAPAVQAEADRLTAMGVDKIILISHLQNIAEDRALAPMLRDIDVMIAGGGDELLKNPWNPLSPGDTPSQVFGPYPLTATDADGQSLPIITTAGQYKYVGRLVVSFDKAGEVIDIDEQRSGPVRVIGFDDGDATTTDHILDPDPAVQAQVVDPINAFVAGLAANVLAVSEVPLDGTRPNIRQQETNLGNLVADSQLWQAQQSAGAFGVDEPQIGLQTGGGIRNESLIPAGNITELHTFQILAFGNFVSVMEDVTAGHLKELLETSISTLPTNNGRFGHWAGLRFTYDVDEQRRVISTDGTCTVGEPGERVQTIVVGGETIYDASLVDPWLVDETTWTVDMTTNDFTFRGGDCYEFYDRPFTTVGQTYQQGLANYLTSPEGLNGVISAEQYPPAPPALRVIPV